MSTAWRRRLMRIGGVAAAIVMFPIVAMELLRVGFFTMGMVLPFLDGHETRNVVREWWERHDALAIDQRLEWTLAEKWKARQTFELTEVITEPMKRACLATWLRWRADDPAWELAWRSDRPVWWRASTGSSTVMVEFSSGVVRAFRTKSHGRWPWNGGVIRFRLPRNHGHICAAEGRLRFVPVSGGWGAYTFRVHGD